MLGSRAHWQAEQAAERSRFRQESESEVERASSELDSLLADLRLARGRRIALLETEGRAKLLQREYAERRKRLAEEERIEAEKQRVAQEQRKFAEEERAIKKRAEEERALREKAEKEEAERGLELARRQREEALRKQRAEAAAKARAEAEAESKRRSAAAEAEAKAKAESDAAARRKTEEAAKAEQEKARSSGATDWSQVDSEFKANQERILWIKNNVRYAMSSQPPDVKNRTMDIKLELRPKFGMLTNSKRQLVQTRDAVKSILTTVQSSGNELVYFWTLNTYAKMLVEQSESEANVKLQNALPLAMLTVLLWEDFPQIGDFVIPRFIKKCPQIIGYSGSINTEEGRKRMGWKKDEDTGKFETMEQYMGRMSGICAVWAAMTQTRLGNRKVQHPYNLSHSWQFLARTLNRPKVDVTQADYAIVAAWWDMTAVRFHEAFGKQAEKLLNMAWDAWTEGSMDPPALRLRGLGENWKATGKIDHAWEQLKP